MQLVERSCHTWTNEQEEFLSDKWGVNTYQYMSENLGKSIDAIKQKADRLGLGPYLEAGGYITLNAFFDTIGRGGSKSYVTQSWKKKGLPIKYKRRLKARIRIIYINDFWEWAEKYRTIIDFSRIEKNILGKEPDWVKDQRKADYLLSLYKKTPWTTDEDIRLHQLLKMYCYGYRELSIKLQRTEGAIKRRMNDLKLIERPLREDPHSTWTDEQIEVLTDLYNKGYKPPVMAQFIEKSSSAIGGKIEVMVKKELLPIRYI